MKIITQQIYQGQSKQVQQDLNSILNKWKWGDQPIKSSQEFLNKFSPWINKKLQEEKELKEFLKRKKVKSLKDLE